MAKKAKVKKKLVPSANKVASQKVNTVNTNTMGGFVKSKSINSDEKIASANRVKASQVPKADNVSQQVAVMEVQAEQDKIDNNNIYDESIGYGRAEKGETGTAAVARIKESRKAKVKRKGY